MAIMFVVGEGWVRRHGHAPELYDSAIITVWVCPIVQLRDLYADNMAVSISGNRYSAPSPFSSSLRHLFPSEHIHRALGWRMERQGHAAHVSSWF
jgi:hypothetical protein